MFYLYIKQDIDGVITHFERCVITKPLKEVEHFGFKFVLHKSNQKDLKKFMYTETKTGMTTGAFDTIEDAQKSFDECISLGKGKVALAIGKGIVKLKELENKFS